MGIRLYDDGTHGDIIADDGIYTLDYIIPSNIDIEKARVIGHFQDQLGNMAEPISTEGKIIIHSPPSGVKLFKPELIGSSYNSLYLSWSANSDTDFFNYKIFRADSANVDSSSYLINVISDQVVTTMVDSNLQENTTYYYCLYVFDTQGLSTGSNIVQGRTRMKLPPAPVNLLYPVVNNEHSISLSWTQSNDKDFVSYRLFRSKNTFVDNQGIPIFVSVNRDETYYQDNELQSSTTYFYRLYVYNTIGRFTGSNIVSTTTFTNTQPTPVILAEPSANAPNSLRLTWSRNKDSDFDSYRIYRSKTENVDPTFAPIEVISNQAITSYNDLGLESGTLYYYRIYVFDNEDLFSGSNTVNGMTLP